MRESCDTSSECTTYISIDQSHLSCLIVVLVMHILDQVQSIYIHSCQPIHHNVILLNNFIIIQILGSDRLVCRTYLSLCLLINTTVDSVKQTLSQVCTSAEELHFLTGLCSGYTAADGVVIAPYNTHNIIILILDRRCLNGNLCSILTEVLWQVLGIQNSHVRFRSRSHSLQCMQDTIIVLSNHGTSVYAKTSDSQSSPYRVTREQLVVRLNTSELNHTQLHYEVVNDLLSLSLVDNAILKVSLHININESGYTSDGHCSTVLSLDSY